MMYLPALRKQESLLYRTGDRRNIPLNDIPPERAIWIRYQLNVIGSVLVSSFPSNSSALAVFQFSVNLSRKVQILSLLLD